MDSNQFVDFSERTDSNTAIKFTLPSSLVEMLNEFSDHLQKSKTEIVREALEYRFSSDVIFQRRLYFFEKNLVSGQEIEKISENLGRASKGTLIKVACSSTNTPDSPMIFIGNLVRVKDGKVAFDLPVNFRPTELSDSLMNDIHATKLNGGKLVFPHVLSTNTLYGNENRYIYEIDMKYIWGVDTLSTTFLVEN